MQAFNARCYLASSVMLGAASESVFNALAEAFVAAQDNPSGAIRTLADTRVTYIQRFEELRRRLEPIRREFPEHLRDGPAWTPWPTCYASPATKQDILAGAGAWQQPV